MHTPIRVLQIGLGPIGLNIVKLIVQKTTLHLVGAVDIDPIKEGKDVGELAGIGKIKMSVKSSLDTFLTAKTKKPHVAVVSTISNMEAILPLIQTLVTNGIYVITTCEELVFPWATKPQQSQALDELAKQHHVAVLATGVNPGFLMDFFPVSLTAVCPNIDNIYVERIQNAQFRRLPFQRKIGMGLTREEFFRQVKNGTLRHIGLIESVYLIASKLGWKLDHIEDTIEPAIATKQVFFGDIFIAKGDILGVTQLCKAFVGDTEVIKLFFKAVIGETEPRDHVIIRGESSMEVTIRHGLNGDVATCSIVVNAIHIIMNAKHGLRTMADIEPISFYP